MWTDILKVQVLGTKQRVKMGIRPLPKNEEDSCLKRLKEWLVKFNTLKSKYRPTKEQKIDDSALLKMSEESACKLLKEFKEAGGNLFHQNSYKTRLYHEPSVYISHQWEKTNGPINLVFILSWEFIYKYNNKLLGEVEEVGDFYLRWDEGSYSERDLEIIVVELRKICREV